MNEERISAWAVCRLPHTDEPVLFVQEKGEVETLPSLQSLNGREGFVMAPFDTEAGLPILLIRPDRVLRGWEEVEVRAVLENYPFVTELSGFSGASAGPGGACKVTAEETPRGPGMESAAYEQSFRTFLSALHEGRFHKLVLSRKQTVEIPCRFSPWAAFREACRRYPRMMVYLCYTPQAGLWMGSSPEIVLSGELTQWHTVALAGTMPLEYGALPGSWDCKNSMEQQFVSDYLKTSLQTLGKIDREEGPYAVQAGALAHLKTDFFFRLSSSSYLGDVLQLLHPTPAVCGLPKEEARQFIVTHEPHERRYYSGITGWISPTASTELYVNLRCMEIISPRSAQLYAGGGILPQSDFRSEWKETEEKIQTMKVITGN